MNSLLEHVRLESPGWLAVLVLVPLVLLTLRGSLAHESWGKRAVTVLLRSTVIAAVVLALCSPAIETLRERGLVVMLVDQSDSLAPEASRRAREYCQAVLERMPPSRVTIVPFAARPGSGSTGAWPDAPVLDAEGTDLTAAFGAMPTAVSNARIERGILLSDGNSTVSGDVLSAARAVQVPIDAVPLPTRREPDVWLSRVASPGESRPGEPVPMEVAVDSNTAAEATIRVVCGGSEVANQQLAVEPGTQTARLSVPLAAGPRDVFRVLLEATPDSVESNNSLDTVVWHGAPARALLIADDADRVSGLADVLREEKFAVETRASEQLPDRLDEMAKYDLIVLADVPATGTTQTRLDLLHEYVHDRSGGLIVFGGHNSLTAGGYRGTRLEEALPVTCEYDAKASRPALAMVLAIDRSGSMDEGGAIDLARRATRETVQMLDAQDRLGVIAFEDTTRWIVPLRPCDDKQAVLREIESLTAGGGTNLYPAIAKAHRALDETFADLKHIVVLTDGISYPADFDSLASDVAASGITISTVAVGSEAAEPLLRMIAELGGGNYYHCATAEEVPEIFVRETVKAGKMGIREGPSLVTLTDSLEASLSASATQPPALLGYVQTRARAEAQVEMTSEAGDPLLARWGLGEGNAAVVTTDVAGEWSRPWQDWPGQELLWKTLARQTVRKADNKRYWLTAHREGDESQITLDAMSDANRFENDAEVDVQITSPDGDEARAAMPLIAPGRYGARVSTPAEGIYDFTATCRLSGEVVFSGKCSVCPGYPAEKIPAVPNEQLLREVTRVTGGRFDPAANEPWPTGGKPGFSRRPIGHYALLFAVVVYLVELALRRRVRSRI